MKILHLSNDEKFVPLALSLFEQAFAGQNRFMLSRVLPGAIRHVAPSPQVSHHRSRRFRWPWIARDLAAADCVVVHLMSWRFAPVLRHVRADTLVVWLAGGGDYMALLEPALGNLLLPKTAELLRILDGAPREAVPAHAAPSLLKPPPVVAVAHRIDVFSANPADAQLLRGVLPSLRAELHTIPSFTVEDVFAAGTLPMAGPDVLLGNSATPTNNHLEALELLRGRLLPGGRVVAPLSYGMAHNDYAGAVAEAGHTALGDRFDPLRGWMPIEAYNTRVARCGIVFMNHLRQQAVGNISAALYRGATVYLRQKNPLFGFFIDLGITLRAIDELEADPRAPLRELASHEKLRNRQAIEARYGRDRVVGRIRALEGFRR
jgi:hypothetical protein